MIEANAVDAGDWGDVMARRKEYQVLVSRFRGWWYVEVPALGIITQSGRFTQAEAAARFSIAQVLGRGDDSFDVAVELRSAEQRTAPDHWLNPAG